MALVDAILKSFDHPDEIREMTRGRFEIVRIADMTIGRATYEPGWKWSEHVGPPLGLTRCTVAHVGLVRLEVERLAAGPADDLADIEVVIELLLHAGDLGGAVAGRVQLAGPEHMS